MGLEEYQGMDDSQKLTVLCVKFDNLEERLGSLPPCPSPKCGAHETRLTRMETILAIEGAAIVIIVPVLMWLIDKVWGG